MLKPDLKYNLIPAHDERLSTVCEEVRKEHTDTALLPELIENMYRIMEDKGGIGLAAPQVGVLLRIIVIKYGATEATIFNPVITKTPGKIITSLNEGCLSYPNTRASIKRYKRVIVEGYNKEWKKVRYDFRGTAAFCAQHEIDHLNGITLRHPKKKEV